MFQDFEYIEPLDTTDEATIDQDQRENADGNESLFKKRIEFNLMDGDEPDQPVEIMINEE